MKYPKRVVLGIGYPWWYEHKRIGLLGHPVPCGQQNELKRDGWSNQFKYRLVLERVDKGGR